MAMRSYQKKPLYRRVNRTAHGAPRGHGGAARDERHSKASKRSEATKKGMGPNHRHGLDYTPLYQFLLSKVGQNWDDVLAEAISRLDQEDPIWHLVARTEEDMRPVVRTGESSYFSGLIVDDDNRIAIVAPQIGPEDIYPQCPCCTHTFNGQPVTRPYDAEKRHLLVDID